MKKVKVATMVLLMLAICTASVAALPTKVTKTYGSDTVTLELVVSKYVSSTVSCYKNGVSGIIRLDSFTTKYRRSNGTGSVYSNNKSGQTNIGLVSETFKVPVGYNVVSANATASVDYYGFHESVAW